MIVIALEEETGLLDQRNCWNAAFKMAIIRLPKRVATSSSMAALVSQSWVSVWQKVTLLNQSDVL